MRIICLLGLLACSHEPGSNIDPALDDGDTIIGVTSETLASGLGTVTNVRNLAKCPQGAPAGATCRQVTVTNCPGITSEPIDAVVAVSTPASTVRGTVVHFSGGGGRGFQTGGAHQYDTAGFRNVFIAWLADWEQTQSLGIKTAGCRPATILRWVFDEPTLHAGSRSTAFCGEGFSGGSGQLGYALADYGLSDFLDYVNELSGPPFSRIDLGCNGAAPPSATVCGATDTLRLPQSVATWENIRSPLSCGSTNVPATELARWQSDSIAIGGSYDYPKTQVQFFACTYQATAVTAQGKIYFDLISQAANGDPNRAQYHCYTQADGCQGEGLGTGNSDATQALLANCVPRHQ